MEADSDERRELFRPEVLIYRREKTISSAVISQSSAVKIMVWGSIGLMCFALLVLCLIRYKETESARGMLQHTAPSQQIKSPNSAVVALVTVTEGELVDKGQTLMRLSTVILNGSGESRQSSTIRRLRLKEESLEMQLDMDERLYKAESERHSLSIASLAFTISGLELEADLLAKQEALSRSNIQALAHLLNNSNISQSQFDRELLKHLGIEREKNSVESRIYAAKSELEDGTLQLGLLVLDYEDKQFKVANEARQLANEIIDLHQGTSISIQALESGVVASLAVETGSSVSAGQILLTILPNQQSLQATIFVPSRLIGRIQEEQELLLEFDAFPISKFGYTTASVVMISTGPLDPRETLLPVPGLNEPVFKVIAELEKYYVEGPETFPLVSGIQFSADFVMEDLSLLEFIFKPVLKLKGKIL
jgi:membrane fusion protein|tara:strand:- start:3777 stop:5045 length:1269 start_codon:yes stop_codon:yes gene_type:complete